MYTSISVKMQAFNDKAGMITKQRRSRDLINRCFLAVYNEISSGNIACISLTKLSEKYGFNRASLYRYFEDNNALIKAVINCIKSVPDEHKSEIDQALIEYYMLTNK